MENLELLSKNALSSIDEHIRCASLIAANTVEKMARIILKANKSLDEFVMGMGTAFFSNKHDDNLDLDDIPAARELARFIWAVDHELHVTGNPMRFTAEGPKVTNW